MSTNKLLLECSTLHDDWLVHQREVDRLTEARQKIHQKIKRLHKDYEGVRQISRDAKAAREAVENEWMTLEEQIDRLKEHLEKATNAKEALALETNIGNLQPKSDELAAQVEALLAKEAKAKANTAAEKEKAVAAEAELKENDARLADLMEREAAMASALHEEHIAACNRLDKDTRHKYDWLIARLGDAVATVEGESCSGCGSLMPPAVALHAKNVEEVSNCPHCSRFFAKPQ